MSEQETAKCAYCGIAGVKLTRDHIISRDMGGSNHSENVQLLCFPCHSAKTNIENSVREILGAEDDSEIKTQPEVWRAEQGGKNLNWLITIVNDGTGHSRGKLVMRLGKRQLYAHRIARLPELERQLVILESENQSLRQQLHELQMSADSEAHLANELMQQVEALTAENADAGTG